MDGLQIREREGIWAGAHVKISSMASLSHPEIFKFQDVIKIKKINKQFSHSFKKNSNIYFSLQGI